MKTFLILVLSLTVAGCASNGGFYAHKKTEQSAIVRSKFPNPLKIVGGGEVSVFFEAIDGSRIMPSLMTGDVREVYVQPGARRILVGCKAGVAPPRAGRVEIPLLAEAGGNYLFTAVPAVGGFTVEVRESNVDGSTDTLVQSAFAPITETLRIQIAP